MAFIRFLVYSNTWIALAAALLTKSSIELFGHLDSNASIKLMAFAFFGTLAGYNWLRWLALKFGRINQHNERLIWLGTRKRLIWILICIGGAGVLTILPSLTWRQTSIASTTFIITAMYGIPVAAFKNKALRQIPYLKIFLIAFCWVGVTAAIPLADAKMDSSNITFCAAQVLFIFGITIPFDIRDVQSDSPENFTIAQRLGLRWAKILSVVCMPIVIYNYSFLPISSIQMWALSIPALVAIPLLLMANPNRKDLYYTGLIDGLMVLQGTMVWLLSC